MLRPHSRVKGLAVNQNAVGRRTNAFNPADEAAFAGERIDLVETPFAFAHEVYRIFRAHDRASAAFVTKTSFDVDKKIVCAPTAHVFRFFFQIFDDRTAINIKANAGIFKYLVTDNLAFGAIDKETRLRAYVGHLA